MPDPSEAMTADRALQCLPRAVMTFDPVRDEHHEIVDLRWVTSNDKACTLVGRTREELVGRRLLEEMPGNRDSGLFEGYCRVIATGEPFIHELRYTFDGFDHWFEIHAERAGPGIVVVFDDVTQRRKLEEERDIARQRMNAAFRSAPFPVLLVDVDTNRIETSNDAAFEAFGHDKRSTDDVKAFFADLRSPSRVAALVERASTSNAIEQSAVQRFRGRDRYVKIAASRVPSTNLVELVVADITTEVAARKQAQRMSQKKSDVLGILGHELRNPLGALSCAADALAIVASSPEALEHVRGTMKRQIDVLTSLLTNILDASAIEHGKMQPNIERCDLSEIMRRAVRDVSLRQRDRIRLTEVWPSGPLDGFADPTRLYQVCANLVANAFKFTDQGSVSVVLRRDGEDAVFVVEDTGIGIPTDQLESIFGVFEQVGSSNKGGLGLGLALVAKLVEMHGGSVRAHSEGEGRGSRFVVRLPLAGPAPSSDAPGIPAPP